MRWEDETYVKLYVRDTPTWLAMSWQAKCLLPLLMRKVDKAGLLECGSIGRSVVALMVGLPEDVTAAGLESLEQLDVVEWLGNTLALINFEEAQEARKSDIIRKRDQRQKAKDKARAEALKNTELSHGVTRGHAESRDVTRGHPPDSPSQLSSDSTDLKPLRGADAPPPAKAPRRAPDGRHHALIASLGGVFLEVRGTRYGFNAGKDAVAVKWLLAQGSDEEILSRWRKGLRASGFASVATISELRGKWNHLASQDSPLDAEDRASLFGNGFVGVREAG